MRRFHIRRGNEVLVEGVLWRDGQATTCASRLWGGVGLVLEWYSRDNPGASLIWIDEAHESTRGNPMDVVNAQKGEHRAGLGAARFRLDAMMAEVSKRKAGKLPSERAVEIYKERFRLPESNARELLTEDQTLWDVLDERLGRAP